MQNAIERDAQRKDHNDVVVGALAAGKRCVSPAEGMHRT